MNLLSDYLMNPSNLFLALGRRGFLKFLPDKWYINLIWKYKMKTKLDWNNPKSFNEKLQWLKINDRNKQYNALVDKYEVRNLVKKMIGEEYLIPIYGLWDNVDAINFDKLPNQFVLKCTHDSGSVIICRDKSNFDIYKAQEKLKRAMRKNAYWYAREWPYKDLQPRIIAEAYMNDVEQKSLIDYKFFCFNGKPRFLYVSQGMENHSTATMSFYDLNGNQMEFKRSDYCPMPGELKKPKNLSQMIDIAYKTAQMIQSPFVRVDLYEINQKIYFSEFTLFPCGAFLPFDPPEWDEKIGNMMDLSRLS